jgi:hypothetical protein
MRVKESKGASVFAGESTIASQGPGSLIDPELTVTTVCFQANNSICENPNIPLVRQSSDERPLLHKNKACDRVGVVQFFRDPLMGAV